MDQDLGCNWCGDYSNGSCSTTSCVNNDVRYNGLLCPAAPANDCSLLSCSQCLTNKQCSFCGLLGDNGYGFCVSGAGVCFNNDDVTDPSKCPSFDAARTSICESLRLRIDIVLLVLSNALPQLQTMFNSTKHSRLLVVWRLRQRHV
jgi:hypothetical protein